LRWRGFGSFELLYAFPPRTGGNEGKMLSEAFLAVWRVASVTSWISKESSKTI